MIASLLSIYYQLTFLIYHYNVRSLSQVQEAIVNFFQMKSWEEAANKFGDSVCSERLLRFRVKLTIA